MSKDRFAELKRNREELDADTDISIAKHFAVVDMEAPNLEDFFNQVNALRNSMDKIANLVEDVEQLQGSMLASQMVTGKKEKLEETMAQVKLLAHQIRKDLNRMKQMHDNPFSKKISQRIIEGQIDGMTKNFCEIMNKYYQMIVNYREKCKERVQRQCELAGFMKSDPEIEEMLECGRVPLYTEILVENEQAKEELNLLESRHQEVTNLEQSIQEVHDMMFDIAKLIESHDDQIKTVADNVESTCQHVHEVEPIITDAVKVSHCLPSKKKIGFMVVTILFIVYLITKLISFLRPF